jgi:hypothetical protein
MNAIEAAIAQIQRIITERMGGDGDLHLAEVRALAQALDVLTCAQQQQCATAAAPTQSGPEGFPLVERFLAHLRSIGRSPATVARHRRELELWSVWLMLQGVPVRLATPELVGRFLVERAELQGPHRAGVQRSLASLQALYAWAEHMGLVGQNPAREVRPNYVPATAVH